MLSLGALGYGAVGDGQVVLLPACVAGKLKRWPSKLSCSMLYSKL